MWVRLLHILPYLMNLDHNLDYNTYNTQNSNSVLVRQLAESGDIKLIDWFDSNTSTFLKETRGIQHVKRGNLCILNLLYKNNEYNNSTVK